MKRGERNLERRGASVVWWLFIQTTGWGSRNAVIAESITRAGGTGENRQVNVDGAEQSNDWREAAERGLLTGGHGAVGWGRGPDSFHTQGNTTG
jgi:hypothetical protein